MPENRLVGNRWKFLSIVVVVVPVLALTACGEKLTTAYLAPVPTEVTIKEASRVPSTTSTIVLTTTTLFVPTTVVLTAPTASAVAAPTTTLAGGPIPEAEAGFCADLAVESGALILEVERVLPADGVLDPLSQRALLLATRNLLAWTNNRIPSELSADVGLLNRVYADLGIELDRLDSEMVTMPRLQALVFTYVLDSPVVDPQELDLSARRLGAFVDQSCGHGFPIMEAMNDLFSPEPTPIAATLPDD
ncbi:MAG: hypothetical protein P8M16_09120 [Acidimicrobiales bacterium]|nr:hypothetical protein [Acidimicrobiales bacterium]